MIKFFRKIRYNLMSENKTGKYFKYAIGEILLVMIGILLALQVNNWNESKQLTQKEIIILSELKKALESDLKNELIPAINYHDNARTALYKIDDFYNNIDTITDDSLTIYFRRYLGGPWILVINSAAFENLKSTGVDVISNDSLRSKISLLYSYEYPTAKEIGQVAYDYFDEQLRPIVIDNVNLYKPKLSETELYSLKHNIQIINRLPILNRSMFFYSRQINDVKAKVESLIEDIDQELDLLYK